MTKHLVVFATLALAGCNANSGAFNSRPPAGSYAEFKQIRAEARDICIDIDAGATEPDFQQCQSRATRVLIDQRYPASSPSGAYQAPAYVPPPPISSPKLDLRKELPGSCIVLPLGPAATVTCN